MEGKRLFCRRIITESIFHSLYWALSPPSPSPNYKYKNTNVKNGLHMNITATSNRDMFLVNLRWHSQCSSEYYHQQKVWDGFAKRSWPLKWHDLAQLSYSQENLCYWIGVTTRHVLCARLNGEGGSYVEDWFVLWNVNFIGYLSNFIKDIWYIISDILLPHFVSF